jgi:putative hydrolase of the HAD superfamily
MYKAVLFDLFGTLIYSPSMDKYRLMVAEIAGALNQSYDSFYEPWMSINDGRLDGSFGSSEGDILAAAELVGANVSEEQMVQCTDIRRSITREFLYPKDGVIEMLDELRTMGCQLGLVTDCVFDVPAIWPGTAFATYFSAMYFSCEAQIRKPAASTYQSVLKQLGVEPDEALFVGDGGSDELNGAERCGIDALMIDDLVAGEMLRVGVTDWQGQRVTNVADILAAARR